MNTRRRQPHHCELIALNLLAVEVAFLMLSMVHAPQTSAFKRSVRFTNDDSGVCEVYSDL